MIFHLTNGVPLLNCKSYKGLNKSTPCIKKSRLFHAEGIKIRGGGVLKKWIDLHEWADE